MNFETILLEKENNIGKITLNRLDKRNAISRKMMEELVVAIEDVARDDSVRLVLLTGAGKAFCAGADTDMMTGGSQSETLEADSVEELRRAFVFQAAKKLILGLHKMEKSTLAMVNGVCVGAGFDLALACDIRTGCEHSRFMCGFVKIGLYPGFGATWLYPKLMGLGKAMEMLFTGDIMEAEEAYRLGILNKLFPADKLEEETMAMARKIAGGPPIAIRLMKASVYKSYLNDLETILNDAAVAESITLLSKDHKEGITAMREKRSPRFTGK